MRGPGSKRINKQIKYVQCVTSNSVWIYSLLGYIGNKSTKGHNLAHENCGINNIYQVSLKQIAENILAGLGNQW